MKQTNPLDRGISIALILSLTMLTLPRLSYSQEMQGQVQPPPGTSAQPQATVDAQQQDAYSQAGASLPPGVAQGSAPIYYSQPQRPDLYGDLLTPVVPTYAPDPNNSCFQYIHHISVAYPGTAPYSALENERRALDVARRTNGAFSDPWTYIGGFLGGLLGAAITPFFPPLGFVAGAGVFGWLTHHWASYENPTTTQLEMASRQNRISCITTYETAAMPYGDQMTQNPEMYNGMTPIGGPVRYVDPSTGAAPDQGPAQQQGAPNDATAPQGGPAVPPAAPGAAPVAPAN